MSGRRDIDSAGVSDSLTLIGIGPRNDCSLLIGLCVNGAQKSSLGQDVRDCRDNNILIDTGEAPAKFDLTESSDLNAHQNI